MSDYCFRIFTGASAAILLLCVLAGCSDDGLTEPARPQTPDFELENLDGGTFRLSDHQGQVVLLQFFAVWCQTCQSETSTLNTLHEDLADSGLVIAAIPVESGEKETVEGFVDEYDVEYRVLYDEEQIVAPAYGVRRTPTTYLIDREGWISGRFTGGRTLQGYKDALRPLLDGGGL